jgi:predicted amidohydrolase YtcJ
MDDRRPEAEALALAGDRIAAVGDADEINKLVSEKTRIIEPKGELVAPAFVEGHGHFVGLGQSKMILDLSAAKSWEEIVQLVEETAGKTPPGQWIVGRGWHQDKWVRAPTPNVEGCPTHVQLSRATPRHPVMLTHATGHMCLANALAMERAGVEERAASASGGEILNATSSPCCCRNCSRGSNCRCGP